MHLPAGIFGACNPCAQAVMMEKIKETFVRFLDYVPYIQVNLAAEGLDVRSSSRENVVGMPEAISRYDPLPTYNGYNNQKILRVFIVIIADCSAEIQQRPRCYRRKRRYVRWHGTSV